MTKSTQTYPTDLNDTEWAQIAPLLPGTKATGRPREHTWREILDAIFYITKNGCVWRALPSDFPAWQTVYYYFRTFRKNGFWEELNFAGIEYERYPFSLILRRTISAMLAISFK